MKELYVLSYEWSDHSGYGVIDATFSAQKSDEMYKLLVEHGDCSKYFRVDVFNIAD
jgi:hypothetical protein